MFKARATSASDHEVQDAIQHVAQNAERHAAQNASQNAVQELRELPVEVVVPNPDQPRRHFDEDTLQDLADSIGELGVQQPVLVRPAPDGSYEILAGERRWRAAKIAGLETIPALVSTHDDAAALQIALIENMAREDLNPVEQARACATLVNEFGLTQEQVGRPLGRSYGTVSSLIGLLRLSEEILEFIERGQLGWSHGTALLKVEDLEARQRLARAAVQDGWSLRALRDRIRAEHLEGLESQRECGEQPRDPQQARDLDALNVATTWGDLLGAEVHVRPMQKDQMRMEVVFDFAAEGLALAERLTSVVAGGSTGR
jgi:ParB family transcriptional regulator, chromosome partitioning protein